MDAPLALLAVNMMPGLKLYMDMIVTDTEPKQCIITWQIEMHIRPSYLADADVHLKFLDGRNLRD